jgi:citrate synthase
MKTRVNLIPTLEAANSATSSLEPRNMMMKSAFLVARAAGWIGAAVS